MIYDKNHYSDDDGGGQWFVKNMIHLIYSDGDDNWWYIELLFFNISSYIMIMR